MTQHETSVVIMKAFCELVSELGFHGASMSKVAKKANLAVGTAYVHFDSKTALINGTYRWIKQELASEVIPSLNMEPSPQEIYSHVWMQTYSYFKKHPAQASFLAQIEESPFHQAAYESMKEIGDPFEEAAQHENFAKAVIELPFLAFYSLSVGLAIRLAATGQEFSKKELQDVMQASWRAVSKP
jgi:AcrR family transcriptional regulator